MLVLAPIVAYQVRWGKGNKEEGRGKKKRAMQIQRAALTRLHASRVRCAQSALSNSRE